MLKKRKNTHRLTSELSWSGTGVHTGDHTTVTVRPAESGAGIRWQRSDQSESPWILNNIRSVVSTERSTDIGKKDLVIKTVEHLLAALTAAGISDVEISVDGAELPILDGSAKVFYDDLMQHRESVDTDAQVWSPQEVLHFTDEGSGATYTIIPSDQLEIEVILDYDLGAGHSLYTRYTADQDFGDWAGARTFVMTSELEYLCEQGLIRGGSMDNAIVIADSPSAQEQLKNALSHIGHTDVEGALTSFENQKLQSPDELARHKVVDLIGDLALLDLPICAKIIARKLGHQGNTSLVRFLRPLLQKEMKVGGYVPYDPSAEPIHDSNDIQAMLPHRYPFALVDKIIEKTDTVVVGVKNITFNEALFQGHFPNNPVFPGVLQMEALAQTGGILALSTVEQPSDWDTYFLKMDNVKFKRMVRPGDTLILRMVLASPIRRGIVHMHGTAFVGNEVVSEGELTAQIVDRTKL